MISPYARQNFVDHKTYSFESWLKIVEERFGVNSMTARDNGANDMMDAFDFTQTPRSAVKLVASKTGSPDPPMLQTVTRPAGSLVTVLSPSGSYGLSPGAIASAYGSNLASTTTSAQSPSLGTSLGGVTVAVADASGNSSNAQIYFVSPTQVNFVVPGALVNGVGRITIFSNGVQAASGALTIYSAAPALYSADATGSGFAAAVTVSGTTYSLVAQCGSSGCTPNPIDASNANQYSTAPGFVQART